jgi:serine/threonine protein kinase
MHGGRIRSGASGCNREVPMSALSCPACGLLWKAPEFAGAPPQHCPACNSSSVKQVEPTSRQDHPLDETFPAPFPLEFRVLGVLGEGAHGKVWLAEDLRLDRFVALKTINLRRHSAAEAEALLALLEREARMLAAVRHPNVVQVHALRTTGDESFLILQHVPGGSLKHRLLQEGALGWGRATRYVADVAEGLTRVHGQGILHRDIKPGNILWDCRTDEALLSDFGVANRLADARSAAGTAYYMAPEAMDGAASEASDVYSLAVTLFHLTAGDLPFAGPSWDDLQGQARQGLPDPDTRFAGLPASVEEVIRAGMTPDARKRPSLAEFLARLRGALNQSLLDSIPTFIPGKPAPGRAAVHLCVHRVEADGTTSLLTSTRRSTDRILRDLKRVPALPDLVAVYTGQRIRLDVEVDRPGFLVVLNVGPSGNLNLLYPAEPAQPQTPLTPGAPVTVLDADLVPPAGRERVLAFWSQRPLPERPEQLLSRWQAQTPVSAGYRATRDLKRVQQAVQELGPAEWAVATLELDHRAGHASG